jgi:hypothetical protein
MGMLEESRERCTVEGGSLKDISLGTRWFGWRRMEHTNHEADLNHTGSSHAQLHVREGSSRKGMLDCCVVRHKTQWLIPKCCSAAIEPTTSDHLGAR